LKIFGTPNPLNGNPGSPENEKQLMTFNHTDLAGSYIIDLAPFSDDRGWFARYYSADKFEEIGHHATWKQMNHSFTSKTGSVRGMHYQLAPFAEIKLVRCVAGAVYDVIVDLRKNSRTFLKWFGAELSANNRRMMYIPQGFAHGFQTLAENCELLYHHSEYYTPGFEGGLLHNDPMLSITWPLEVTTISERDLNHQQLTTDFEGLNIN
jgi:dTDP-4-dehydrorhamnose 3,5-epimerase